MLYGDENDDNDSYEERDDKNTNHHHHHLHRHYHHHLRHHHHHHHTTYKNNKYCTKWSSNTFFSEYFSLLLLLTSHQCSKHLVLDSVTKTNISEQKRRWNTYDLLSYKPGPYLTIIQNTWNANVYQQISENLETYTRVNPCKYVYIIYSTLMLLGTSYDVMSVNIILILKHHYRS